MIVEKCKLIVIYISFLFSFSGFALAEQTAFDLELYEIQSISDLNLALNKLHEIEQDKHLTVAEQAKVQNARGLVYFSHEDYENSLDTFQRLNKYALAHELYEKSALSH